jgi:hypothetical protein
MAIRAQKPDVFFVGLPVSEASAPCVMTVFRPEFFGRVDVVDVQSAVVGESALGALPAKGVNQRELLCPIARVSMHVVAVLIPIVLLAARLTKPSFRWLAAFLAFAGVGPSVREVAGPSAEFPGAVFQAVRVHHRRLFAVLADDFNRLVSHVSKYITAPERKYFDIACERIAAAYAQGRLFA